MGVLTEAIQHAWSLWSIHMIQLSWANDTIDDLPSLS